MPRFKLQEASNGYDHFLEVVDTQTGRVLGDDYSEPEDATLGRSFSWVVDELNRLTEET